MEPIPAKTYPRFPSVSLPAARPGNPPVDGAIGNGAPVDSGEMTLDGLSAVLAACGPAGEGGGIRPYRSVSGGYPVEVYVLSRQVRGLGPGHLYHFELMDGSLEDLWPAPPPSTEEPAAATLILTTVISRLAGRAAPEQAMSLCLLEAGAVGQLCQLASEGAGLPVRLLGGIDRSGIAAMLDLPDDEVPLALVEIG